MFQKKLVIVLILRCPNAGALATLGRKLSSGFMCASKTLQHIRVFYNNSCEEGQFGVEDKFGSSNIRLNIPARVRSPPVTVIFSVSTSLQMLRSLLLINLGKCSRRVMHLNLCECTTIPCWCTASPRGGRTLRAN